MLKKKAGIRKRLLATAAEIVCCPTPAKQIPARFRGGERSYLCLNLAGMDRLESGIEEGMSLRCIAVLHELIRHCCAVPREE